MANSPGPPDLHEPPRQNTQPNSCHFDPSLVISSEARNLSATRNLDVPGVISTVPSMSFRPSLEDSAHSKNASFNRLTTELSFSTATLTFWSMRPLSRTSDFTPNYGNPSINRSRYVPHSKFRSGFFKMKFRPTKKRVSLCGFARKRGDRKEPFATIRRAQSRAGSP